MQRLIYSHMEGLPLTKVHSTTTKVKSSQGKLFPSPTSPRHHTPNPVCHPMELLLINVLNKLLQFKKRCYPFRHFDITTFAELCEESRCQSKATSIFRILTNLGMWLCMEQIQPVFTLMIWGMPSYDMRKVPQCVCVESHFCTYRMVNVNSPILQGIDLVVDI